MGKEDIIIIVNDVYAFLVYGTEHDGTYKSISSLAEKLYNYYVTDCKRVASISDSGYVEDDDELEFEEIRSWDVFPLLNTRNLNTK